MLEINNLCHLHRAYWRIFFVLGKDENIKKSTNQFSIIRIAYILCFVNRKYLISILNCAYHTILDFVFSKYLLYILTAFN